MSKFTQTLFSIILFFTFQSKHKREILSLFHLLFIFYPPTKQTLTVCLVRIKIGRMENKERKIWQKMLFSPVWFAKEMERMENPGENFLSRVHIFVPFKSGGKAGGEKKCSQHYYANTPLPPTLTYELMTLSPTLPHLRTSFA